MLLEAKNISVSFPKENQRFFFRKERQHVVRDVSLKIRRGECLGIIGESGSGKSTLGRVLSGLLKPQAGEVHMKGVNIHTPASAEEKSSIHKSVSIVFQDYTSSVNPRFTVKRIIDEALKGEKNTKVRIIELLNMVGLDETFIDRFPHELSGGQLQRVCIARAIAVEPELILLDEAVSSLDASTQTQVMDLLKELQKKFGFSYIFITHDLPSVTYMCDRVVFFLEGRIEEEIESIYDLPGVKSPYANKLLNSILEI